LQVDSTTLLGESRHYGGIARRPGGRAGNAPGLLTVDLARTFHVTQTSRSILTMEMTLIIVFPTRRDVHVQRWSELKRRLRTRLCLPSHSHPQSAQRLRSGVDTSNNLESSSASIRCTAPGGRTTTAPLRR
jgi:hypothetical protein